MNKLNHISSWRLRPLLLIGLILVLSVLPLTQKVALAHPLDVYLQATYITVAPTQIVVELDLTPGVLVAPAILPELDPDGDEQITEAEGRAYVDALLQEVVLQIDGADLALTIDKIDLPAYINVQAGYGTIRVFTTAALAADLTGTHQIAFANNYAPTGSAYQVNAFVDKSVPVTLGQMARENNQQRATMDFVIESTASTTGAVAAPTAAATTATAATTTAAANVASAFGLDPNAAGQANKLMTFLYAPMLTPWVLLVALALALVLGGLHALTPGHGKTLVAAYLIGSRGTVRHAIALGAIVTFTHTASVIAIGLLALFASQYIVPSVLTPLLQILSGLLVVVIGIRLIWQRWFTFRRPTADLQHNHSHDHSHDRGHRHDHNQEQDHVHPHLHANGFTHDHGDGHVHSHLPPAEGITFSNLLALGVSGGLLPCPEALGIMVIAIGLNRILLGLGLIVSFSFGLAAVLIVIGVLLVRSRALIDRFGGLSSRWSSALPLASAVIVTVLGVGITLGGLSSYMG